MRIRVTTRNSMLSLITIWTCLFTFTLTSSPQLFLFGCVESTEIESPAEEDGESEKEELEGISSARRKLKKRRSRVANRLNISRNRSLQLALNTSFFSTIIGHQFSNGLCAPLLV